VVKYYCVKVLAYISKEEKMQNKQTYKRIQRTND
jgi:hypothetical protein